MAGRKKYTRPQAVCFADSYSISSGFYLPGGDEYTDFLILSDHNRQEIQVKPQRIENRKRMINGTMRSFHVADKQTFQWAYKQFPSRAYSSAPTFLESGTSTYESHTVDGGAGGNELLDWYSDHSGSFYMLLAYDLYSELPTPGLTGLNQYNAVVPVYFSNFDYSVTGRGLDFDLWDISIAVEEQ